MLKKLITLFCLVVFSFQIIAQTTNAIKNLNIGSIENKSFWKRMEYGLNNQSQRPSCLLPVITDIALTMGYKLSDKSIIGIGVFYKMGWGKNINHISLTSQGIGLRTYVDIKIKDTIWIIGEYEQDYMQAFEKISQLDEYSKWQKSGLIGINNKYKVAKKTGNHQLLWDFLSS